MLDKNLKKLLKITHFPCLPYFLNRVKIKIGTRRWKLQIFIFQSHFPIEIWTRFQQSGRYWNWLIFSKFRIFCQNRQFLIKKPKNSWKIPNFNTFQIFEIEFKFQSGDGVKKLQIFFFPTPFPNWNVSSIWRIRKVLKLVNF